MSSPDFVFFPIHTKISITLHKLIALQILRHMYLSLELLPRLSRIELPAPCQIFILGMILPAQSTLIPLVWAYSKLHLTGSYVGMDMLYVAGAAAFSIMLVTGFINTVPISLEESAR